MLNDLRIRSGISTWRRALCSEAWPCRSGNLGPQRQPYPIMEGGGCHGPPHRCSPAALIPAFLSAPPSEAHRFPAALSCLSPSSLHRFVTPLPFPLPANTSWHVSFMPRGRGGGLHVIKYGFADVVLLLRATRAESAQPSHPDGRYPRSKRAALMSYFMFHVDYFLVTHIQPCVNAAGKWENNYRMTSWSGKPIQNAGAWEKAHS